MHDKNNFFWVGGKHACLEILKNNKRKILKLYATNNFIDKYPYLKKKAEIVKYEKISRLFKSNLFEHQGIALKISALSFSSISQEKKLEQFQTILILDEITDQRNIVSIIRTALAFYVDAVIIDKRIFNQKNELMLKSAAGAFENIKIYTTSNITNEIRFLKKNKFWVYGLDVNAKKYIEKNKFNKKKSFNIRLRVKRSKANSEKEL